MCAYNAGASRLVVACESCECETCPQLQQSVHLRQSIIDDEIWQADEPYGPFLLLQLLVFPELICAADQELCAYVCISERGRGRKRGRERESERERPCPYVTVFAHEHSTSIFPLLNMSDLNMKTENFFILQPPRAHMATKLRVKVCG